MLARMRRCLIIGAVMLLAVVAAEPATSVPSAGMIIKTAYNAELKKTIVVDGRGRTVYMLVTDTTGVPTCAGLSPACPKAWPAVPANGTPVAGKGINGARLAVVKGAGGVKQVRYNNHPLYTFYGGSGAPTGDRKPGQVRGQGFYGIWYVLSPQGKPIK
jgi:predicted lipoprotein with Yx(FWY)xxD motif